MLELYKFYAGDTYHLGSFMIIKTIESLVWQKF